MEFKEKSPSSPQTLNDLIRALSTSDKRCYPHLFQSIKFKPSDFDAYASWSEECYVRNCLVDNENFELILICWSFGQKTPIHDHGGEECWVKIIDGTLKETIYQKNKNGALKSIRSSISEINQVSYMKDFMGFHCLENKANQRSMSLHLYAKPIRQCNVFDEKSKSFTSKEMFYHTTPYLITK